MFNVYDPRQSLSNPYTGVLAIFLSRLLAGQPPVIYEDGLQTRDFASVYDEAEGHRVAVRVQAHEEAVSHHVGEVASNRKDARPWR